jgi:hypothetical protein
MSDLIQENVQTVPIADLVPKQVTVGCAKSMPNAGVGARNLVCTENLIRVDEAMESPKLAE